MALLPIFQYPHPILRKVSEPVTWFGEELAEYGKDLLETMHNEGGGVGLAAVQTGRPWRIVAMDCSPRQKKSHGELLLLNPVITESEGSKIVREGCMSLPNYLGLVERARRVNVTAQDLNGHTYEYEFKQLEAICIQHEIDHLDGKLFIDRVKLLHRDLIPRGYVSKA